MRKKLEKSSKKPTKKINKNDGFRSMPHKHSYMFPLYIERLISYLYSILMMFLSFKHWLLMSNYRLSRLI